MSDSANKLPVMTDEQRRENLEKATAVRKERKALLDLVRQGSVTFEQASADPKYWRIPVVRLLIAVPGIGKAKAMPAHGPSWHRPESSSQGPRLPPARLHHRPSPRIQGLSHALICGARVFRGGHISLCCRHGPAPLSLAGEGAAASSSSYLIDSISWVGSHAFPTPHLFDSFPSFM